MLSLFFPILCLNKLSGFSTLCRISVLGLPHVCDLLEARIPSKIFLKMNEESLGKMHNLFSNVEIYVFPQKSFLSWNLVVFVISLRSDLNYLSPEMAPICYHSKYTLGCERKYQGNHRTTLGKKFY